MEGFACSGQIYSWIQISLLDYVECKQSLCCPIFHKQKYRGPNLCVCVLISSGIQPTVIIMLTSSHVFPFICLTTVSHTCFSSWLERKIPSITPSGYQTPPSLFGLRRRPSAS